MNGGDVIGHDKGYEEAKTWHALAVSSLLDRGGEHCSSHEQKRKGSTYDVIATVFKLLGVPQTWKGTLF